VVEVDVDRKRISLSMKLDVEGGACASNRTRENRFEGAARGQTPRRAPEQPVQSAMGSAFAKLQSLKK
jgi:uncharacterized protein